MYSGPGLGVASISTITRAITLLHIQICTYCIVTFELLQCAILYYGRMQVPSHT